jgi:hypothetical protein
VLRALAGLVVGVIRLVCANVVVVVSLSTTVAARPVV